MRMRARISHCDLFTSMHAAGVDRSRRDQHADMALNPRNGHVVGKAKQDLDHETLARQSPLYRLKTRRCVWRHAALGPDQFGESGFPCDLGSVARSCAISLAF